MITYEKPVATSGNIDAFRLATIRTADGITISTYVFLTADGDDAGDEVEIVNPTVEAIEAECARRA